MKFINRRCLVGIKIIIENFEYGVKFNLEIYVLYYWFISFEFLVFIVKVDRFFFLSSRFL